MNLVVFEALKPVRCAGCRQGPLPMLVREDGVPRCLHCVDLGHLVYLPRGNAALTRRAREGSSLYAVVVRYEKRRRRHERQGLLVEEEALARAEVRCLADAEARARRRERDRVLREASDARFTAAFAAEIRRLFPGIPPERALAVAAHASVRGSGRVGRTAAGRALDEDAVSVAVRASVRHVDTEYDALLMAGVPRHRARARLAPRIEAILAAWRRPAAA
ncbi:DUF2293 domain-containing protein [Streptomyces bambusae]|uniref:DUF2293 domain-containing protein n=1 Tax=Streptomyces bambusae TaxID=1550616 RepID=UPI001CFC4ACC|nr:DUF2293 domain-containing protein [Streptomyces bambusae]MCB5166786.1 DUF2293 domain-containing protein [Streptomyces bambusae]